MNINKKTASKGWENSLDFLKIYIAREGHAMVPHKHKENGRSVGSWVSTQRTAYKNNVLQSDRVKALENLKGWRWGCDISNKYWNALFKLLKVYVIREGHARVRQGHKEGGKTLGTWVCSQRKAYNNGSMLAERAKRLEKIPHWIKDSY